MQSKSKTKAAIRKELLKQIDEYIQNGGDINVVERGISGREDNSPPLQFTYIPSESQTRTDISFLLKTIDARKQKNAAKPQKPQKRLIYDDFGEPLRWVWDNKNH